MSGSLDVFQGKWEELDKSVAIQARDAHQKVVDSWKDSGEKQIHARTTVLLTASEEDGTESSRLSTSHRSISDIRETLEDAIVAESASAESGGHQELLVAGIWAARLAADYTPGLMAELELLTSVILKPISSLNYDGAPVSLIETVAKKPATEVSDEDIESGYMLVRSVITDPIVSDIEVLLREIREKIERALQANPSIGFHADL